MTIDRPDTGQLADAVRAVIYQVTVERGRPPGVEELAERFAVSRDEILAVFRWLHELRLLVPAPEDGEIVMAPPFSAVPTTFLVDCGGRSYYANCVWDAYGIPAALGRDAEIDASCGCCGQPIPLAVEGGEAAPVQGVAHFAVPAAHWWDDITYT